MRDITSLNQKTHPGSQRMLRHHVHDHCEIYYLLKGNRKHFVGDFSADLAPGSLMFVNSRVLHRGTPGSNETVESFLLYFRMEFLQKWQRSFSQVNFASLLQRSYLVVHFEGREKAYVEQLIQMLMEAKQNNYEAMIQLKTLELLMLLVEKQKLSKVEESKQVAEVKLNRYREITDYLGARHYQATLDEVCEHFFISRSYICRLFKEVSGMTMTEYINTNKVRRAQELLEYSEQRVIEVAELAGFESLAQFGRVFKEHTGKSPREYRNQCKSIQHSQEEAKSDKNVVQLIG